MTTKRSDRGISGPLPTLDAARALSPRRNTTQAESVEALAREQLEHFSIDPQSALGQRLAHVAAHVYEAHAGVHELWAQGVSELKRLDRGDRVAYFNAKRFLCFQLAKVLDSLQTPLRKTYQSLIDNRMSRVPKGPYPVFDNVTALFSATPVIARTATYLYACTEWIDDAFRGKELLHEIYSRLLNPTSISLANHIVDLGQVNTVVLCPALTSHSELPAAALEEAGIAPTTIRIAVGDEDPRELLAHFIRASALVLDQVSPGFSARFPRAEAVDGLYRDVYLDTHERYLQALPPMHALLG